MAAIQGIGGIAGFATGVVQQLANVAFGHVGWPMIVRGDFLEPRSEAAESGADFVDSLVRTITRAKPPADPEQLRAYRPLLASTSFAVPAGHGLPVRLTFRASVANVSFGVPGRESALVAVYVNGRYHSDMPLLAERPDEYSINLGMLPAGSHTIEIRSAIDAQPTLAGLTHVSGVQVHQLTGMRALIERHSPILEFADRRRNAAATITTTDTPLLVVPEVQRHRDGRVTITYSVLFSNEDGGTKTDDLFRKYGRGTDYEMVYRVELGRDGRLLRSWYQGPRHGVYRFTGDFEGGRPILRVASHNNIFSQRLTESSRRWSAAPTDPVPAGSGSLAIMARHGWTFAVMGKELLREGRTGMLDRLGMHIPVDARSFLYLQGIPEGVVDALKAGRELVAHLSDGRRLALKADRIDPQRGEAALELPAGITDALVAVSGLGRRGSALVLDASWRPRSVAVR